MPDPATYRPAPGSIPVEPGVYRFRDPHGRVIYVGKAKSLRSRLTSYFADISGLHPRTRQMVETAESVEWTAGLKDEELDIQGRHPFLGETVIREMVKMLYIHNQLHYRDVKRALK